MPVIRYTRSSETSPVAVHRNREEMRIIPHAHGDDGGFIIFFFYSTVKTLSLNVFNNHTTSVSYFKKRNYDVGFHISAARFRNERFEEKKIRGRHEVWKRRSEKLGRRDVRHTIIRFDGREWSARNVKRTTNVSRKTEHADNAARPSFVVTHAVRTRPNGRRGTGKVHARFDRVGVTRGWIPVANT